MKAWDRPSDPLTAPPQGASRSTAEDGRTRIRCQRRLMPGLNARDGSNVHFRRNTASWPAMEAVCDPLVGADRMPIATISGRGGVRV